MDKTTLMWFAFFICGWVIGRWARRIRRKQSLEHDLRLRTPEQQKSWKPTGQYQPKEFRRVRKD